MAAGGGGGGPRRPPPPPPPRRAAAFPYRVVMIAANLGVPAPVASS
jgi:hypothetical protein